MGWLLSVIGLLLVACSSPPSAATSEKPSASALASPPASPSPSIAAPSRPSVTPPAGSPAGGSPVVVAGLWEGDNPRVTFTVTAAGAIVDFVLHAPLADSSTCLIEPKTTIPIRAGSITIAPVPGDPSSAQYIRGTFDAAPDRSGTTVTGVYRITTCPDGRSLSAPGDLAEHRWGAGLKLGIR